MGGAGSYLRARTTLKDEGETRGKEVAQAVPVAAATASRKPSIEFPNSLVRVEPRQPIPTPDKGLQWLLLGDCLAMGQANLPIVRPRGERIVAGVAQWG